MRRRLLEEIVHTLLVLLFIYSFVLDWVQVGKISRFSFIQLLFDMSGFVELLGNVQGVGGLLGMPTVDVETVMTILVVSMGMIGLGLILAGLVRKPKAVQAGGVLSFLGILVFYGAVGTPYTKLLEGYYLAGALSILIIVYGIYMKFSTSEPRS